MRCVLDSPVLDSPVLWRCREKTSRRSLPPPSPRHRQSIDGTPSRCIWTQRIARQVLLADGAAVSAAGECHTGKQTPCFVPSFFGRFATTQLARHLHQERTKVVCSNKEAWKRLARRHSRNGPWTYWQTHTHVVK